MRIVVTGADGFIGRNLICRLAEMGHADVGRITRATSPDGFREILASADLVFHLAGVNRPRHVSEFETGNADLTDRLCRTLAEAGRTAPVVFASSTQAALDNPYGLSKLKAEQSLLRHSEETGSPVHLLRLPNVFGKWCRPDYNSVVATFCHNIARGLPIKVNDPAAPIRLIHVDDVVDTLIGLLGNPLAAGSSAAIGPVHESTVGEVAAMLQEFAASRVSLLTPRVGTGFTRALYSTYISYLPSQSFDYPLRSHSDPRGVFVEMLKTPDCGQFSFFTAHPGVTRGEHYHHAKTEKFLVISGTARFAFRSLATGDVFELVTRGGEPRVVETIPGWVHNITNIGNDELIVMLWANEIFDPARPDTISMKVAP